MAGETEFIELNVELTGVHNAISALNDVDNTAAQVAKAARDMTSGLQAASHMFAQVRTNADAGGKQLIQMADAAKTLRTALADASGAYANMALTNPDLNAEQRLARQYGSVDAGVQAAAIEGNIRQAASATLLGDADAVLAQRQADLTARLQHWNETGRAATATQALIHARREVEIQDMTRAEQAQIRYTESTRALRQAQMEVNNATRAVQHDGSTANYTRQANALENLTQATLRQAAARREMNAVRDDAREAAAAQREQQRAQMRNSQAGLEAAQARLREANRNREIGQMGQLEAAQARLGDATSRLGGAMNALRRAEDAVAGANTPANMDRLTQATNNAASALNQYERARQAATHAEEQAQQEQLNAGNTAFQQSYAYFMLGGILKRVADSVLGTAKATVKASAEIERSFADTQRTFEGTTFQLAQLKTRLRELSTETPISIVDLSGIATMGNQLGIAAEDIEGFTSVIARYAAITGQTADNASTAFGRISNLTGLSAKNYENLASAISYTARTTVATESTIQNTTKEITALAAGSGFSADAIIGLAGALSSLAIPPERARGALSLYFGALNRAVAEGGPKLRAFAELTNMTTDELDRLVRSNRGQEVFTKFISGLSELDTVAKSTALKQLGLSTIRVDQTMRALSQNVPLVTQSLEGSWRAYHMNTELAHQYGIVQDTLEAKMQRFANAVQNVSGSVGDRLAPALKEVIDGLVDLLVWADKFAKSPFGKAVIVVTAALAGFLTLLLGAIGAVAMAGASLIILRHAVMQVGWDASNAGLRGWVASLASADMAQRRAALSLGALGAAARASAAGWLTTGQAATAARARVLEATGSINLANTAMYATGAASRVLAGALNLLRAAWPLLAISAAVYAFNSIRDAIDKARNPSKRLTEDLSGLTDALMADNAEAVREAVQGTGEAASKASPKVSTFNQGLMAAIDIQRQASEEINKTTNALNAQTLAFGEASAAWVADALLGSDIIKDLTEERGWWEKTLQRDPSGMDPLVRQAEVKRAVSQGRSADELVSQDEFYKMLQFGLDLPELLKISETQGREAMQAAYDAWAEGVKKAHPNAGLDGALEVFGMELLPDLADQVADATKKARIEATLTAAAMSETGDTVYATAKDFNEFGDYIGGEFTDELAGVDVVFQGITENIDAFRDATQEAMKGFVDSGNVLKRAQDALGGDKDAKVTASGFGKALSEANADALSFYTGLMQLADSGNGAFAMQLAQLGPEAQPILASALKAGPEALAQIEADARFAAFLGSKAFKEAMEAEMNVEDENYARIFKIGGMDKVREYIAAQVAGTGDVWRDEWNKANPKVQLSTEIDPPGPEDQAKLKSELAKDLKINITPVYKFNIATGERELVAQKINDQLDGLNILMSPEINGQDLTDQVTAWREQKNANPDELKAKIEEQSMTNSVDAWVATQAPLQLQATVTPVLKPGSLGGLNLFVPGGKVGGYAGPGEYSIPGFASGGGWQVRGPGSGISDSILARLSAGEYVNTAKSTKFWGVDFFDSLNRNMLPTNFASMLGAAALSGNRGPTHVANVNINQNNPLTRDPLKQLRESSENLAAGIWS